MENDGNSVLDERPLLLDHPSRNVVISAQRDGSDSLRVTSANRFPHMKSDLTPTGPVMPYLKYRYNELVALGCVGFGGIFWILPPISDELSVASMRLLGVFVGMILALVFTSFSLAPVVSVAFVFLVLGQAAQCTTQGGSHVPCLQCGTVDDLTGQVYQCKGYMNAFEVGLSGFSNHVPHLVLYSFFLGQAIEKTGLGTRLSRLLLKKFGGSLLGLSYAIVFAEIFLAPFLPSNTARGGSIVSPLVLGLCDMLQSHHSRIPAFLVLVASHANLLSSSFFITGTASNPIVTAAAERVFGIKFDFVTWFIGALVPATICAFLLPRILMRSLKVPLNAISGSHNRDLRNNQGKEPPLGSEERNLLLTLGMALLLWVTTSLTHLSETFVALLAVIALMLTNTLTWSEMCANKKAWDTFFWLSLMMTISTQLVTLNISTFLANRITSILPQSPFISLLFLGFLFFMSMFIFSSITAHVVALADPFLTAAKTLGVKPMLITATLAYFSALSACMTNFSSGPTVIYFGFGKVSRSAWFRHGFNVAALYLSVYFTLGIAWWYLIGWSA